MTKVIPLIDDISLAIIKELRIFINSLCDKKFRIENIEISDPTIDPFHLSNTVELKFIPESVIKIINNKYISIEIGYYSQDFEINELIDWLISKNICDHIVCISYRFKDWASLKNFKNLITLSLDINSGHNEIITPTQFNWLNELHVEKLNNNIIKFLGKSIENILTLNIDSDYQEASCNLINKFKNLTFLISSNVEISDLEKLKLKKLNFISINNNVNLNFLSGCPSLQHITGKIDATVPQTSGPALISINRYLSSSDFNLDNINTSKLKSFSSYTGNVNLSKPIPTLNDFTYRFNASKDFSPAKFKLSTLTLLPNLNSLNISSVEVDIDLDNCNEHSSLYDMTISDSNLNNLDFLKFFPNLEQVNVYRNSIENLEPIVNLSNIVHVNASNNNIVDIHPELHKSYALCVKEQSDKEKNIILYGNPLMSPPIEILERGGNAVELYFDSMVGDTEELNEAKIIFLGNGEVGKTSLMKVLGGDAFNSEEETTHGINITKYSVPINEQYSVDASIWDFGGQQIMHATHQLFLSRRCVYVLVINDRRDDLQQEQKINYWLQQVQTYGGNSKVIIIKNKSDMFSLNNVPEGKLKEKYPNLIAIESVSCKTGDNVSRVRNLINEQVRQLPMRKVQLAKNWIQIKDEIKALSHEHDHLPLSRFTDICNAHGVTNYEAQKTLRNLLHDLSVIIAFEELDGFNMGILNPHWITDGIYTIINSDLLSKKKGYIKLSDVQRELDKEHPSDYVNKASFIIEAMMQFELCHPIGNAANKTYLVPNLLPNEIKSKELRPGKNTIRFVFKYENLLPPSVIPNLLVRMSSQIADDKRWRTGAIMTDTNLNVQALVEEDSIERELKITVTGTQARDFFAVIRHEIRNLNEPNTEALGVKELVPLVPYSNEYVDYKELIGLEIMGKAIYSSGKLQKEFSVSHLLSGIESREETESSVARQREEINVKVEVNQAPISIKTGDVTNTNSTTVSTEQSQVSTLSVDIKVEQRSLKGTADYVLEDLKSEAEYEIVNEIDRERFIKECNKVQKAIGDIEQVESQEDADSKPGAFMRVKDFLSNALQKTGPIGESVEALGDHITKVRDLAKKYNKVAGFFGFPTVPEILLD